MGSIDFVRQFLTLKVCSCLIQKFWANYGPWWDAPPATDELSSCFCKQVAVWVPFYCSKGDFRVFSVVSPGRIHNSCWMFLERILAIKISLTTSCAPVLLFNDIWLLDPLDVRKRVPDTHDQHEPRCLFIDLLWYNSSPSWIVEHSYHGTLWTW